MTEASGRLTRADLERAIERIRAPRVPTGPCPTGGPHIVHPLDYQAGGWVRCASCFGLVLIDPNPSKERAVPKFRPKQPVVVEAETWDGSVLEATRIINWVLAGGGTARYHEPIAAEGDEPAAPPYLAVDTADEFDVVGTHQAHAGDFVVRGVTGRFFVRSAEDFAATYEPDTADLGGGLHYDTEAGR